MVFNVVAFNHDDHTKNLAFLLPREGAWTLAPAYDLTRAFNPRGEWTQRHQMSINSKFDQITLADIYVVDSAQAIPAHKSITKEIIAVATAWVSHADRADVNEATLKNIAEDIADHRSR